MAPPRKRKPLPVLMGQPSPSLARISRMKDEQLTQHIASLTTERERLEQKIGRLEAMHEPPSDRIATLRTQVERLEALEKMARDRMAQRQQSPSQGYRSARPSRGYRRSTP